MARFRMEVRVGRAGNGTPVFMAHGANPTLGRPFGATWDPGRAAWMYPAFYPASTKVLADFEAVSRDADVILSDAALAHVRELDTVRDRLQQRWLPPGFEFATKPYGHQIDGLCHVYYNLRAALFYEQGLGKCKIAVDLIRLLKHAGAPATALVLGPRITVMNWGREIDLHSGRQVTWAPIVGTPAQKRAAVDRAAGEGTDIILSTYDTARSLVDFLVDRLPYVVLVCDESHNVKAWSSSRARATWEIAQKAMRRVLMTGSPTEGNPIDLYAPFKILGDCFMPEPFHAYKKKFVCFAGEHSPVVTGYKNLDVVNARTTFLASRRTKAECLDLPPRTFVDVEYALSDAQGVSYNQIVSTLGIDPVELAALVQALRTKDAGHVPALPAIPPSMELPHRAAALIKLLQITSGFLVKNEKDPSFCDHAEGGGPCQHMQDCVDNGIKPRTPRCRVDPSPWPTSITWFDDNPKLDAIVETLSGVLDDPSHKAIVWCEHLPEMDLVCGRLGKAGLEHVRMDGSVDRPQDVVDAFNDDPRVRAYVGQMATGVGVTLNAASYVVYSSLPYSLLKYTQSLDRNYRIGQGQSVTVYRMLGQGTLEAAIAFLLDHKIDVDALLTNKIECALCPHSVRCLASGVEPFQAGCVHPRRVARPTVKARMLPMFPGGER